MFLGATGKIKDVKNTRTMVGGRTMYQASRPPDNAKDLA
jgi:hypothetical protein